MTCYPKKLSNKLFSIRTRYLLLFYFSSIFVFAAFYYLAWLNNTSVYIISDQINIQAKRAWQVHDYDIRPENVRESDASISLENHRLKIAPIEKAILDRQSAIGDLESAIAVLETKRDSLSEIVWDNYHRNLDNQIAKRTTGIDDEVQIAVIRAETHDEAVKHLQLYQSGPGYEDYVLVADRIGQCKDSIYHCKSEIPKLRRDIYESSEKFYTDRRW